MPRPSWVRSVLAAAAGAAVAALGAQIAGEYELGGVVALAAGAGIGAAVAEVVVAVSGRSGRIEAAVAAVLAAAGVVWAGWLDSGEGLEPFPAMAWAGAAVAALVAAWRGTARRRATASRG